MKTKSTITNESLARKEQAKMENETRSINRLSGLTRSPFTTENVFKFKENPKWELEKELDKLDKELKGHLRHLRPVAEKEIRDGFDADYFDPIEKCFEDAPRGLRPEDIELRDGILSYTPAYTESRLAVATLELSEKESKLFNALSEARKAAKKLKELIGGGMWSGEIEAIIFGEQDVSEVGFNYFTAARLREKFHHQNN